MKRNKETKKDLSRRDFIKTTAVGVGATALAGLGSAEVKTIPPDQVPKWDYEADVVDVGYGAAGAAAAIAAHDLGAEVLILEKMPLPGGNTALTVGPGFVAGGTSYQREAGVTDSPDAFYQWLITASRETVDPEVTRAYVERAPDTLEWLRELGFGVSAPTSPPSRLPWVQDYTPRSHNITPSGGAAFFKKLDAVVKARGIKILLETKGVALVASVQGEVIGLKAESEGKELYVKARKGVVLADGGFAGKKEMLKAYCFEGYEAVLRGHPGCTGDGIRMAQMLGADLINMEYIMSGVLVRKYAPNKFITLSGLEPCIYVDRRGSRFVDEATAHYYRGYMIWRMAEDTAFMVFDEETKRMGFSGRLSSDLRKEIEDGVVLQASTIGELATKIGVNPAKLEDTVNSYNLDCETGIDPKFGKPERYLKPLKTPPFYAIEITGGMGTTQGGVRINGKSQVKNTFGDVIPRLYAAGRAAGGHMAPLYILSGYGAASALVSGRIAGENAAAETPWL
ncbi:MAG: FAD-binding protein [Acidobacteria bacterium]|nr:FAD-binding protein [Acidobacteriota bacterium]